MENAELEKELEKYAENEKPDEQEDLIRRISAIKGLPLERERHRYSSFSASMEGFEGKESLEKNSAQEIATLLSEENLPLEFQNELKMIEGSEDDETRYEKIREIEKKIARVIAETGNLNLQQLRFLSELNQLQPVVGLDRELLKVLETKNTISWGLKNQLAVLNRLNDRRGNLILHKVLDFAEMVTDEAQNLTPQEEQELDLYGYSQGFVLNFNQFAEEEKILSKNYLIQKHWENLHEMVGKFDEGKEGTIHGVAGGSADSTIYTFKNIDKSYQYRASLGINEGYPIANPVLRIAPGYCGFYRNHGLSAVYECSNIDQQKVEEREKRYIAKNDPKDEYIYDQLNEPFPLTGQFRHPSNKLQRLQEIWDFASRMKKEGKKFYFDISRVDKEELHPLVYANLLTRNQEYLHEAEGKENQAVPLAPEEYKKRLFPSGRIQEDREYNYRYLMSLGMRKKIEDDFGIDMAEIPIYSQVQFLNYLDSREIDKFERLKGILEKNSGCKREIIVSFLALADDEQNAETLLELAESLSNSPETAKNLFSTYSRFVELAQEKANQILEIHRQIFSSSSLDQPQVVNSLLTRANELLLESANRIQEQGSADKAGVVQGLTAKFIREEKALGTTYTDFAQAAEEVKKEIEVLSKTAYGPSSEAHKTLFEKGTTSSGIEHFIRFIRQTDLVSPEMEELIKNDPELGAVFKDYKRDIQGKLVHPSHYEHNRSQILQQLEKLLVFQKNFERKFEALVKREAEVALDKEFFADLEKEVQGLGPENLPRQKPLYFPAGISKEFEQWDRVWQGELQAAKPIDLYAYLFWLNNQGKPVELVVCDEMQVQNYLPLAQKRYQETGDKRFKLDEGKLRTKTQRIGDWEIENYKRIINTFGLNNIEVSTYQQFLARAEEKGFADWHKLCEKLAEDKLWKDFLLSMVQESLPKDASDEEKKKFLGYAIEEVAWILATDGTKISHLNEARYDIAAAVMQNLEQRLADEQGIADDKPHPELFTETDRAVLVPKLKDVVKDLSDFINRKKSEAQNKKSNEELEYFKRADYHLGNLRFALKKEKVLSQQTVPAGKKKSFLKFNFGVAATGAQSFRWQRAGSRGEEQRYDESVQFREPYSTYFYQTGGELFLNSDQVVALPEGQIAGKILALSSESQKKYAERVLKPLIVNFFKTLEEAPQSYFESAGKSRQELLTEIKESSSVTEVLRFAQKYIVRPVAEAKQVSGSANSRAG